MHYWADLQLVHGFRCHDNIHMCELIALYPANAYSTEREMSVSACTRSVAGLNLAEQFEFVWLLLMIEIILLMASCCGLEIILWPENTILQVGAC